MELLVAASITSVMSVVLGGLILAVQAAWEHTRGLEDAVLQSRAGIDRIRYMVSQAGVYKLAGQPARPGLAVVPRQSSDDELPEILVVWSGGRQGGLAAQGVQQRLPRTDELLVYAPDPQNPARLVEIAFPGDASPLDFAAADFADRILALIASAEARPLVLCDRIRRSRLQGSGSPTVAANVRFELHTTPADDQLADVSPGTADWYDLPWVQGVVSAEAGMRQATLRMELQLEPRERTLAGTDAKPVAIPFLGSAAYRYLWRPE